MWKLGGRFRIAFAPALVALTAWCAAAVADTPAVDVGTWLGVQVRPLSETWRSQWDYQGSGVLLTAVTPGGPADHAGLMAGDLLVALGSVSLWDEDDMVVAKGRLDPNQPVTAVVARNNGHMIKIVNMEPAGDTGAASGSASAVESPPPAAEPAASAAAPPPPNAAAPGGASVAAESSAPVPAAAMPAASDASSSASPAPAASVPDASTPDVAASTQTTPDHWAEFGTQCADLNSDLASALGVPVEYGVLVLQVASGGFADRVGIKAGDVITASGDHNIVRAEALQQVVEAAATSVMLHVQRGAVGRDVDVSLELPPTPKAQDAARPEDAAVMRDQVQALQREIDKLRAQLKSQAKD